MRRRQAAVYVAFVVTALVALLFATSDGATAQVARQAPAQGPSAPACTVTETSRTPLIVERAREMYIEPLVVLPSRGEILLAGTPNYLFSPGAPGTSRALVQDSVFGAILGVDGRARLVPAPIDATRIVGARGVALDGGGWAFVFAESKEPPLPSGVHTLLRVWHGVFDGTSWTRLEKLPEPSIGPVRLLGSSDLIVRADTVFFAAPVEIPGSRARVALFERRGGKWTTRIIDTNGAAYAQMGYLDSLGLVLAVVRPDRSMSRDQNSLFLHSPRADSTTPRKIIQGYPQPVYNPAFNMSADGPVLTWMALTTSGNHLRAMVGAIDAGTPVLTLDSASLSFSLVRGRREAPLWVSEHADPGGARELRFITHASRDRPVLVAKWPNPFTGFFAAAAVTPVEMIISGPLLRSEPPNPSLVTLLIRARVACAGGAP